MPKNCLNCRVERVKDLFGEDESLASILTGRRILLVADSNVVQRTEGLGKRIGAYVQRHGLDLAAAPVVLYGGERIKEDNLQSAMKVVDAAIGCGLKATDCIVALGGGALLDVVGWAASIVGGGIGLVRVPTTPAAMLAGAFAESACLSRGGKKDVLVVRSVPEAVLLDEAFVPTVLDGVWWAGFGEAVRLAVAHRDVKTLDKLASLADAYRAKDVTAFGAALDLTLALRRKKGGSDFALAEVKELNVRTGGRMPYGYGVASAVPIAMSRAAEGGDETLRELLAQVRQTLDKSGALIGARQARGCNLTDVFEA